MKLVPFLFAFSIYLILSAILSTASASSSVGIFAPKSKPYGLSYEEQIENYWQWLISLPADQSPYKDKTGINCAHGQSETNSSVFYLSGGGGGKFSRTCNVPAGKGVLIPVMVVEVSDKEVPGASIEDLRRIAQKDQDSVTSLYLKIGDKEYLTQELKKYRTPTSEFEVVFPKNAIFGAPQGAGKAVADGHYIITEPLEKGIYNVIWKSSLSCQTPDCAEANFAEDMNYKLIVE